MNMKKNLVMLAMLLGTGGTAVADNISVVVRSWNDTEKQVIVKTETHDCEDISGWSDSGWPTMDGSQGEKWYYVKQNKTFSNRRLIAKGKVHLVIPDGVTLTLKNGLQVNESDNAELHLHGQQGDDGKLIAECAEYKSAGIGGSKEKSSGTIVIHGGNITAKGNENSSGIGAGGRNEREILHTNITIYGGTINATGGKYCAGIGIGRGWKLYWGKDTESSINIYGGNVTATGGDYGPGIGLGKIDPAYLSVLRIIINIEGGVVTATGGEDGAGIGAGEADVQFYAPSMRDKTGYGLITIGGNAEVRAVGTSYGAGIGGGDDMAGTNVRITGNARVTAIAGDDCDATKRYGGSAIGPGDADGFSGYGNKNYVSGKLELSDHMCVVSAAKESEAGSPSGTQGRVADCRWHNFCRIEPCQHTGASFTYTMSPNEGISADFHEKHCPYCATAIQETHQYVDGTCVCGKQKEVKAVSHVTLNWPKDAQDAAFTGGMDFRVTTGRLFSLPEHKAPEGIDFMGWARTSTKPASIYLQQDEDEESLLHPGELIAVDGDVKIYTRYRKVYEEQWTWSDDKKSCQLTITCPYDGDTRTISAEVKTDEEAATEDEPGYTLYYAVAEYDGISYVDYFYDMHYYTIELKADQDNQATLDKFNGKTVNVNLNRTLSAKKQADGTWQSQTFLVCLPYDFSLPESVVVAEEADVYKLHKIDNEKKEFIFTNEFPSLSAGEPYLIVVKKGEFGLSAEGVEIISEPKEGTAVYDAEMSKVVGRFKGTFKKFTAEEGIKVNAYGMRYKNNWTRYRNDYDGWEARYVRTFCCYFSFDEPTNIDEYMMKFVRTENGDMETGEVTDFPSDWFEGEEGGSDDPTGISSVRTAGSDTRLYDLQGRRVEGQPAKGLYISNGKKIIIK
ncbi:MAG: hypothetical protein IJ898_04150 [Prevotella sp.]|nr:hypothetical protein [Prevotella sp.]